jgi:hypothetical protein
MMMTEGVHLTPECGFIFVETTRNGTGFFLMRE